MAFGGTVNYLEQMTIADAKRLADRLGVSLIALLDASLSLSENVANIGVKCPGDLPQLRDTDASLSA